jgi:hypothetical protein
MKDKTLVMTAIAVMLLIVLFAYYNTFEKSAGQVKTFSFPTSTPTVDLIGTDWWNVLPTPIKVETMDAGQ